MAKIREVLVFVDEPQLVLISHAKSLYLGVATPSLNDGAFFCVSARKTELEKYFSGKADLHYMYVFGKGAQYFIASPAKDENYTMKHYADQPESDLLPDPGFFSTSHTTSFMLDAMSRGREHLLLDGTWQLQDFGRFQQLYAEVYSFFAAIDLLKAAGIGHDVKERLKKLISGLPYQGGGSYLSVFRGLDKGLPKEVGIGLVGIRKNSPGNMVLAGVDSHFGEARSAVEIFIKKSGEARQVYSQLHSYLKRAGLLKENVSKYNVRNPFNSEIESMARSLLENYGVHDYDMLCQICSGNTLAVAKVALGFHRRVSTSAVFFAEGRVRFSENQIT